MRRPLTDRQGEVRELALADIKLMRPVAEVDHGMIEAMKDFRRKVGRPKAENPKVLIGFRLARDIVDGIRKSGRGYNGRVEQALREALERGTFGKKEKREPSFRTASAEKKRGEAKRAGAKRAIRKRRA